MKHSFKTESYIKGIILSSAFNLIAKVVTFLTGMVLMFYFGAKGKTDIYFLLYTTLWLIITVFTSLNIAVIIPEAMRRKAQEGQESAMRLFTFFLYIFFGISVLGMLVFYINPVSIVSIFSKFDTLDSLVLQEYKNLIFLFAPLFPLILVTNYLVDVLNSYKYFTLPVLTGLFNSIVTLVFVVTLHKTLDIYSMLLGVYTGYSLNLLHLLHIMRRDFSWSFMPQKVNVNKLFKENFWIGFVGNLGNLLGKYVPNYFMTGAGAGLFTAYNYGQRTANLPTEIITNQFSAVAAIRLNELMAQKEREKLNAVFLQTCSMLVFILVPIAAMFYFYGESMIRVIYQRGEFGPEDTHNMAFFFRYLGYLLPLAAINTMVTRLYNAGQIIKFSTIYSLISNILVVLFLWLAYSSWGMFGIPFALLAQALLNILAAQFFIGYFFKGVRYWEVLIYLAGITILSMALGYGVHYLGGLMHWTDWVKTPILAELLSLTAGVSLFLIVYLSLNEIFHFNRDVSGYLRKWIRLIKR